MTLRNFVDAMKKENKANYKIKNHPKNNDLQIDSLESFQINSEADLESPAFSEEKAYFYFRQICEGLAVVHEQGLIHRYLLFYSHS